MVGPGGFHHALRGMPFYSFQYMGDSCTCDVGPPDEEELRPEARPRIICDNGPQFIAKDFKEFIRISGMTHVRTSPFYPQSNGKIERWHKLLKGECIRPGTPLSLEDARHLVEGYVEHYNNVRLNSAVGYITPNDVLAGRQEEIPHRPGSEVGSRAGNNGRFVDCRLREKSQRRYIPFCRGT